MLKHDLRLDESLSEEALNRIDQTCLEFEAAWKEGNRPPIERYVGEPPSAERSCLLLELLLLDLDYRRRRGEIPAADEYRTRFPQDGQLVDEAFQLSPPALGRQLNCPRNGALRVCCPHCRQTVDVPDDASLSEITCSSCGGRFSLVPEATVTYRAPETKTIGHFELIEQVGVGAFGSVWKARDTALDRTVAVKIPRKGQLSATETEQFLREARAAAQLRHPTIVGVHEVGREGESVYIVSDYVHGLTLADWLTGQRLAPRQAAELCAKIADALQHAHAAGVVHRDLKPGNIMLDAQGEPHLMDFGLAKRDAGEVTMTLDGQVLGTPAYMSPEQAAGESHKVDGRSDIYSLGVILYELLTGELPFRGNRAMLLHQVLHEEPRPPRKLNHYLPRDLETICLRAMAKEQARRYQRAAELAADLRRYLGGEPIRARPVGRAERLWRWCRRNPVVAGLVGSVVLLLVLIAVGSTLAAIVLSKETHAALGNLQRAEEAEQDATDKLWTAYLAQARAGRFGGRVGQRFDSLDALAKAAAIRPSAELRDEAVACMALVELRVQQRWTVEGRHPSGDAAILYVAFDPSLTRYARADSRGDITIRRAGDDEELFVLRGPSRLERAPRFSPDGRLLASIHMSERKGERQCAIWDLERRKVVFKAPALDDWGAVPDFSPDSRLVAVCGPDRVVRCYEVTTGRPVRPQALKPALSQPPSGNLPVGGNIVPSPSRKAAPNRVSFDAEGRVVAYRCDGSALEVIDRETAQVVWNFSHPGPVYWAAWRPDGKVMAVPCESDIHVWNLETGRELNPLRGHQAQVTHVQFSHAGDLLASSGWDGTVRLWDPVGGKELLQVRGGSILQFSLDDRQLAAADMAEVTVWKLADRECHTLSETPDSDQAVESFGGDFSADGRLWARASSQGVRFWDVVSAREAGFLPLGRTCCVAFLPDGRGLITSSRSGIRFWPITPGAEAAGLRIGPPTVLGRANPGGDGWVAISADGQSLAAVTDLDRITVWNLRRPGDLTWLQRHQSLNLIATSPDGKWVASATWGGEGGVKVWNTHSGTLEKVLFTSRGGESLAFSPDGRWLVTGEDREYRFWKTGSWEPDRTMPRDRESPSRRIAFTPDGRLLAVASTRFALDLIDPATLHRLATLESPAAQKMEHFCFSPDRSRLSAGTDLWDLRRVRERLAAMGLDWDLPPYRSAPETDASKPLRVEVVLEEPDPLKSPGALHYRAGRWQAALAAIQESMQLRFGGNGFDWLFLAMIHHKLGNQPEARKWYDHALRWMERNAFDDPKLAPLRAEADQLLLIGSMKTMGG